VPRICPRWPASAGRLFATQLPDARNGRDTARAMSEEKVEVEKLAASVLDALNRRDPDALLDMVHPDYELHSRLVAVEGNVYKGPEGFREYFRDLEGGFRDFRWEADEIIGEPPGNVVVVFRFRGRGRESGVPVGGLAAQLWIFRDGKVWRNTVYRTKSEALEAAGRSE
jgi:ketosteroid isomerase-like protein